MSRRVAAPDRVTIRPAERADLLAVLRIENASFPQPWPYDAFEWFLGEPAFLVAVADGQRSESDAGPADAEGAGAGVVDAGPVVGYLVADVTETHGRSLGHVKDVAVHPESRGAGIGAALLSRGLSTLVGQGADSVKLEVRASNEAAISLYRSFDFEPLRRVSEYYANDEDAIVMIRELTDAGR